MTRGESWRNGYLTVAIVQFSLVTLLFVTLPVWEKVARSKSKSIAESSSTPSHSAPPAPENERKSSTGFAKGIFSPLRIEGVKPVLTVFLFYCGVEATMGLWGSTYLTRVEGIDVATAAGWVSLYYGSITLGRFISGFVTMRMSSKALIRTGEIAILIGVICLLLPLPDVFSMLSFVLIGLGCAPIFPSMLHETPARFGDEDAQNIMGFQMAVAYMGTSLFPPIFGAIASVTSFALLPFFLFAYIALMLVNSERINHFMLRRKQLHAVPV
jgi:fucose permease